MQKCTPNTKYATISDKNVVCSRVLVEISTTNALSGVKKAFLLPLVTCFDGHWLLPIFLNGAFKGVSGLRDGDVLRS